MTANQCPVLATPSPKRDKQQHYQPGQPVFATKVTEVDYPSLTTKVAEVNRCSLVTTMPTVDCPPLVTKVAEVDHPSLATMVVEVECPPFVVDAHHHSTALLQTQLWQRPIVLLCLLKYLAIPTIAKGPLYQSFPITVHGYPMVRSSHGRASA